VVSLHGLVRDRFGKKMSKSKGNGIDPLAWIEKYGADALRFTLARGANPGADLALAEEWVAGSRNFCSKLFNATRFALLNGATVADAALAPDDLSDADAWILDRLDEVTERTTALLADFQFSKAAEGLYHYAWDEFCDWYVELAKVQMRDESMVATTRAVLGTVLDGLLRLLHPFVPFVTEELWTSLTGGETLVLADWPTPSDRPARESARGFIADLDRLVTEIRRFRADQGLAGNRSVPARLSGPAGLTVPGAALTRLAPAGSDFAPTAALDVTLSAGPVTIEVDTSEAVDIEAEKARIRKDLATAEKEIAATAAKLGNPAFLGKAPDHVVAGIRDRHAAALAERDRLQVRLDALGGAAA